LLPDTSFDAPWLYSLDDFFGSLAHTLNVSRYTLSVNTSCVCYTHSVALPPVTREFYLGFLIGLMLAVLVDQIVRVIIDLAFTHTL
jgi:hypothetical protein